MVYFGVLKTWIDNRAFRFLKNDDPNERDCFVHLTAFEASGIIPTVGQRYSFETETDKRSNRLRAINLKLA
jgi:cold shock CspA family protein